MRKRTRKQQRLMQDLIQLILLVVALVSYIYTRSISFTVIATLVAIAFIIAFSIYRGVREREVLRKSGIADVDVMDGIQFEHYLKELYHTNGYKAEVTKAAGDYGADLILRKDDRKIVIQAKRYNNNVGVTAVQEILAAQGYYKADQAWVVSNSYFTNPAINLAQKVDVKLIDRNQLIKSILAMNPEAMPQNEKAQEETESSPVICDKCNNEMVVRSGKRGKFYGCSAFPRCRNTKNIA